MSSRVRFSAIAAIAAALVVMFILTAPASAADISTLLSRMPSGANAIVVVDVGDFLASPLAQSEGWDNRSSGSAPKSASPLPGVPGLQNVVLASQLDLQTLDPRWEAAILSLDAAPPIERIAKGNGGFTDMIATKLSARTPAVIYLDLSDNLLGAIFPPDRQFASNWVAEIKAGTKISPYLKEKAGQVNEKTQAMFALDLSNAASEAGFRRRMHRNPVEALEGKSAADLEAITKVIATLRGVSLKISMGETASGIATIDFGRDAAPIGDVAKAMLLEFLSENGMSINEIKTWDFTTSGSTVTGKGNLTTLGLRRVLGVISAPKPEIAPDKNAKPGDPKQADPSDPKQARIAASQKYYKTISQIIDNIKPGPSMGDQAKWLIRDAKRIDQLPMVNVDPDLIAWGSDVSAAMFQSAGMFATGQNRTRNRVAGVANSEFGGVGDNYDDSYADAANQQARQKIEEDNRNRRAVATEEKARTTEFAIKPLQDVLDSRAKIRVEMVKRYNVEF